MSNVLSRNPNVCTSERSSYLGTKSQSDFEACMASAVTVKQKAVQNFVPVALTPHFTSWESSLVAGPQVGAGGPADTWQQCPWPAVE